MGRTRKQKIYKMKGCYKKSRKRYLGRGGSSVFPSQGPPPGGFNFLNSQLGGGCGCDAPPMQMGGFNQMGGVNQMRGVTQMGGRRRYRTRNSRRQRQQKGGFLFGELMDLGKYGAGSVYNTFRGYETPPSPMPWKNQLQGSAV